MQVISRPDTWWRCGSSICEAHKSGAHFYSRAQSHCCLATVAASQREGRPVWRVINAAYGCTPARSCYYQVSHFGCLSSSLWTGTGWLLLRLLLFTPHSGQSQLSRKTVKNMNSACREWSNQITLQADLLLTEASWCQSEAHREWLRNKTLCKCRLQTLILYRCCRARVTASVTARVTARVTSTLTYKASKRVWAQPSVLHLKRWVHILHAWCSR